MITIAQIQARVCERFGVERADMRSPRRLRRVARPRQVAMFLARSLTTQSFNQIGRRFDRSPWTVMDACWRIELLCARDPDFAATVAALSEQISEANP